MALSASQLEAIAGWCADGVELRAARTAGRRVFFGEDDPRPVQYWPGAEDLPGRERRFLGWFMFACQLPDGRLPAQVAVEQQPLRQREEALQAIQGHRYVLSTVGTVLSGSVFLDLEDEHFEVRQRSWARLFHRDLVVAAHLLPVRQGVWLPGPGWLELSLTIGPTMRANLKQFQLDPLQLERLLQGRGDPEPPSGVIASSVLTLEEAVELMNQAAREIMLPDLVLSIAEWSALVRQHLDDVAVSKFLGEVLRRAGNLDGIEHVQRLSTLAVQIWNATPQLDRGGLTASELGRLSRVRPDR